MKVFKGQVAKLILASIPPGLSVNVPEITSLLTTPPKSGMGDIAFPCFKFAKLLSRAPGDIAQDITDKISELLTGDSLIESVKTIGPYVNFFIRKVKFYELLINDILVNSTKGFRQAKRNERIVIDYSSPNIAKPIAFHHIRSTVIGNIIGNIFENCGYDVVRINYLGDWGTQFGKLITAFEKYGDDKKLEKEGIKHLLEIYVKYHRDENEELERTAKRWFQLAEKGDRKALSYWKRFRDISIREFERVYRRLMVHFTYTEGESFYNKKASDVIDTIDRAIGVKESEGAIIVDLSKYDMPPVLLKKTDGATLYATREIAVAIDRWNRFSPAESLYVVAHQQELHFKQIFKVLELMGLGWFDRCKHISFGLLHFEDSKMSTRKGNVIFLEDVIDKAVKLAKKAINEKNPGLENKDEVAEAVGVGAVIFGDICKRRLQDIVFRWEDVLNFDGETAPYVQYSHARACSILTKSGIDITSKTVSNYDPELMEFELVKLISIFGEKLLEARNEYEPFILARYVLDLSKLFNRYYYGEKIIDLEDEKEKNSKLALVYSVKEVIKHCLNIMGIKAPERM